MVQALRRSGQSRGAFARRHGIAAQRVKYWVERVEGGASAGASARPSAASAASAAAAGFAPVRVVARGAAAPIEIVMGGATVRVPSEFDEEHLCRVLAALGAVTGGSC